MRDHRDGTLRATQVVAWTRLGTRTLLQGKPQTDRLGILLMFKRNMAAAWLQAYTPRYPFGLQAHAFNAQRVLDDGWQEFAGIRNTVRELVRWNHVKKTVISVGEELIRKRSVVMGIRACVV